jgi:hypothetical protein
MGEVNEETAAMRVRDTRLRIGGERKHFFLQVGPCVDVKGSTGPAIGHVPSKAVLLTTIKATTVELSLSGRFTILFKARSKTPLIKECSMAHVIEGAYESY